jgi:Holliday junction resolvasome RuvABC endonuclease subunit
VLVDHGNLDLGRGRFDGMGVQMVRLVEGLNRTVLASPKPSVVVIEEIRFHKSGDAARMYGAISLRVMEECERLKIPYTGIPPGTVRRLVLGEGRGNAKKAQVARAMSERFDTVFSCHDESDAVACALAWLIDMEVVDGPEAG